MCAACGAVVIYCKDCDKRQRYCSRDCAKLGRQRSVRAAGRRYQRSRKGSQKHAARQEAYTKRCKQKLTHQLFSPGSSSEIVEPAEQKRIEPSTAAMHCNCCGRRCAFVVRSHLHRRRQTRKGEEYDCFKGNRSSYFTLVPC